MITSRFHECKRWFKTFTHKYLTKENISVAVEVKAKHIHHVVDEMEHLTSALQLDEEKREIARTIALFHDVGRFPQIDIYGTMSDSKSVDHADLGLKVIEENHLLDGFDSRVQDIITTAIRYHNKFHLPADLNSDADFFCRLIRDADKLDIYRVLIETAFLKEEKKKADVFLHLPEKDTCSQEILADVKSGNLAKLTDMTCRNDFKLLAMAWVYDLNFKYTREQFLKRNYIQQMSKGLPENDEVKEVVQQIINALSK